jgi:hypothetical protein
MDLTILLSKVFGIYFILVSFVIILRHSFLKSILKNFVEEPMLRFLIGSLMLIGGIFIIVSHQDWSSLPSSFISLIGWLTTIKALLYMSLSNNAVRKWVNSFYIKGYYQVWAPLLALGLGLYLLNYGYGLY